MDKRSCQWCGADISHRHERTHFCNQSCRDRFYWDRDHPRTERCCKWCGADIQHMKRHAVYCSRSCKTKASDERRREDGRAKQRDRERYGSEAEHRKAYARRYLAERPGFAKSLQLLRKARMRAVPVYRFTEADWRRLKQQYRNCCAYCGRESTELQREHLIPLAKGGSHGVGNIVPACPRCNYGKAVSLPIEWKRRLLQEGG